MPFIIPEKIEVVSDGNILQYIQALKTKTELTYQYTYILSETKLNMVVSFTEKELLKMLRHSFKIIEHENNN